MRTAKTKLLLVGLAVVGLAAVGVLATQTPADKPAAAPKPAGWTDAAFLTDHGQMVYAAAFAPDGQRFATAGADGTVIVWDAATLKPTNRFEVVKNLPPPAPAKPAPLPAKGPISWRSPGFAPPPIRLHWTPAGGLWVWHLGADEKWGGTVYDPATGRPTADGAFRQTSAHFWFPVATDGTRLLAPRTPDWDTPPVVRPLTGDGPAVPLDVPKEANSDRTVPIHTGVFARDGKTVVVQEFGPSNDVPAELREVGRLRVCDAATGRTVRLLAQLGGGLVSPQILAADGRHLAVWDDPRSGPTVWDYATWTARRFALPTEDKCQFTAIAFSADGNTLLAAGRRMGDDKKLRFELWTWDVTTGRLRSVIPTHTHLSPAARAGNPFQVLPEVCQIVESPDGRLRLTVYGTPPIFTQRRTAFPWDEPARAANAGLQVWRRGAD